MWKLATVVCAQGLGSLPDCGQFTYPERFATHEACLEAKDTAPDRWWDLLRKLKLDHRHDEVELLIHQCVPAE